MSPLDLYGDAPISLAMDFYQLTSAYAFWRARRHRARAVYHLFFRSLPFGGGYAVAAGLEHVLDWIERFKLSDGDLAFLGEQIGNDGRPLFPDDFLLFLERYRLSCDVHAAPEGTAVFPHEPILRVTGALMDHLLLETFALTAVNSQTLIATKAARVCGAACGAPVLEFGMRRAQGLDGTVGASRACFIGGCSATSNTLAGRLLGIPVRGTHPHGFVMAFDSEPEAFEAYARALPANCVWLVDTYDTLEGVRNAVTAARALKARGHVPAGIRLDSGDLAWLSVEARRILDEAGLQEMRVYASNDLDERLIESLRGQGAQIGVWGVGTKMVTAYDQPALGGVYKMGALEAEPGRWVPKVKVSEQAAKTTIPGVLNVRRYLHDDGTLAADMIYDELHHVTSDTMVDPADPTRQRRFGRGQPYGDLLEQVMAAGQRTAEPPSLREIQTRARYQLDRLHPATRRFDNPHAYPVGIEISLHRERAAMVMQARGLDRREP